MEVYIRNVPEQLTADTLYTELQAILSSLSITIFACQKFRRSATVTFLRPEDSQLFLSRHGQIDNGLGRRVSPPGIVQLRILGQPIFCSRSTKPADAFVLRSLRCEATQAIPSLDGTGQDEYRDTKETCRKFSVSTVSCGMWGYEREEVVFAPQQSLISHGIAEFGINTLTITVRDLSIEFRYESIKNVSIGSSDHSLTLTLDNPPLFAREMSTTQLMKLLQINLPQSTKVDKHTLLRVSGFDDVYGSIAKSCLVYRFSIISPNFNDQVRDLQKLHNIPEMIRYRTHIRPEAADFTTDMRSLKQILSRSKDLPFRVLFQLEKLAKNSYLLPSTVVCLYPDVLRIFQKSGLDVCEAALRMLLKSLPYAGPQAEAAEFEITTLVTKLYQFEEQIRGGQEYLMFENNYFYGKSSSVVSVFRAQVTPTGISLLGPEPEPSNRVLRKYLSRSEYFLRVQFTDEDGELIKYSPIISNEKLYSEIFKKVLENGIEIAGRRYSFLGFSHSSLRARSCWFMAPFRLEGLECTSSSVVSMIGDFRHIRSPAKCAARIGQAFSDTPTTIPIDSAVIKVIPDIQRNGRIFSDGVGTISEAVVKRIWDSLRNKNLKPTCFQIRHSGAKGMISLDTRLHGDVLCLRESMIKFQGSDSTDIELCGVANRPIRMLLNRSLIKILEDLGVEDRFFFELQEEAIHCLRQITTSNSKAVKFLSNPWHSVGDTFYLSLLIQQISQLGLSFRDSPFLRSIVEMGVLLELRDLKYRTRIPVKNGATLYGIMDETGILQEGQVFCILEFEPGSPVVLVGKNIIVTRSPALHPGDVQIVEAVNVPADSPLTQLSNCVCFSQHGARDLPSMLSGGDLDGDLYNIIWDNRAKLKRPHPPAEYPRADPVDIGRMVTTKDITDFFVTFMTSDQLGRIATQHLIVADKCAEGTFHRDCLILADLHSTAVDFAKSGIAPNLSKMPKHSAVRPDFMAKGPHITISRDEIVFLENQRQDIRGANARFKYYESDKILGRLYRAIDEQSLLKEIQQHDNAVATDNRVIKTVWDWIQNKCKLISYKHQLDKARNARKIYEDMVLNVMYAYSEHPLRPLTESEVFVGNILGKTGAATKKQRELSMTMKQQSERDLTWFVTTILNDKEALETCLAMCEVSFEDGVIRNRHEKLRSFKYVAAALCLRQLRREEILSLGCEVDSD